MEMEVAERDVLEREAEEAARKRLWFERVRRFIATTDGELSVHLTDADVEHLADVVTTLLKVEGVV